MQGELFSNTSVSEKRPPDQQTELRRKAKEPKHSLSFEKVLVAVFILVVSYVLVFSYGVDQGRKKTDAEASEQITKLQAEVARLSRRLLNLSARAPAPAISDGVPQARERSPSPPKRIKDDVAEERIFPPERLGDSGDPVVEKQGDPKFTVQLVTYTSFNQAERQVGALKTEGYDAFIISSGRYHQVCIERLTTKQMARSLRSRIQNETGLYADAYIRSATI